MWTACSQTATCSCHRGLLPRPFRPNRLSKRASCSSRHLVLVSSDEDESDSSNVRRDGKFKGYHRLDRILDHKVRRESGRHFFLEWTGDWPFNEMTSWEPEQHLDYCASKFSLYLAKNGLSPTEILRKTSAALTRPGERRVSLA